MSKNHYSLYALIIYILSIASSKEIIAKTYSKEIIAKTLPIYCSTYTDKKYGDFPATYIRRDDGKPIALIIWRFQYSNSLVDSSQKRCAEVSYRLNEYQSAKWPIYFRTGKVNNLNVICMVRNTNKKCDKSKIIMYIPPKVDAKTAMYKLFDIENIVKNGPVYLSKELIFTGENNDTYLDFNLFLKTKLT
jgi:Circadian oscillating protein COP23